MRHLLLAALLGACAQPLAFVVAPSFPTTDEEQIAKAAAYWNSVTVPAKRITLTGGAWRIVEEDPKSGFNGRFIRSEKLIQIHPEPHGTTTYNVALHEFGHALGLYHLCGHDEADAVFLGRDRCDPAHVRGVMDPTYVNGDLSAEDMTECRRVKVCQ